MEVRRWLTMLGSIVLLSGHAHTGMAIEPGKAAEGRAPNPAPVQVQSMNEPMDPVMRAIVIAMAARVLREAAASPDPMAALGESLERTLAAAIASPESVRMVEAITGQAFKEVPEELRQALVAFAVSMLTHVRSEMLRSGKAAR